VDRERKVRKVKRTSKSAYGVTFLNVPMMVDEDDLPVFDGEVVGVQDDIALLIAQRVPGKAVTVDWDALGADYVDQMSTRWAAKRAKEMRAWLDWSGKTSSGPVDQEAINRLADQIEENLRKQSGKADPE